MIKLRGKDNGIKFITEQVPDAGNAAIGIWFRTGAVNEQAEYAGVSHLIEHMMFKGTKKRTAARIASDADDMGSVMNAATGKEYTFYYIRTLTSHVMDSAELLTDMVLDSVFDETELEKEKDVVYEEMKMIADTPDEDAMDEITSLVFQGKPQGNSIIGTRETVGHIDRGYIRDYIRDQYTKDNIVVSAAGEFEEERLWDYFEKRLSVFAEEKEQVKLEGTPYVPRFKTKVKDIEQTHICMACPAISLDDERYYAFLLLSCIIGGGMSSRLFQNIREDKGLAYSVFSMLDCFTKEGMFNIYAGIAHDKIPKAIDAIKEELSLIKREGVTSEEFKRAKEQTKSRRVFAQESMNGKMSFMGRNQLLLGKVRSNKEIIDAIDEVTMDHIEEAIDVVCDIDRYSAVAVTAEEPDMKKLIRG